MEYLVKVAHASGADTVVNTIVPKIVANIVIPILELVFFLAVFLFIWGLLGFFMNGEDTTKREEGRQHILWGVIGMTIMVSVYGIIRFVASSLGQSAVLNSFGF